MKHLSEPPIALLLTMPRAFFADRKMTEDQFCEVFERAMRREDTVWNYRKTQLPTQDVAFVYLVWGGRVQYRLNFVAYERHTGKTFTDAPDGKARWFPPSNWIILSGPAIKAPRDIPMKGFQGHRYLTKELF